MLSISISAVLIHELILLKLWEAIECWKLNGSSESNSYISNIVN